MQAKDIPDTAILSRIRSIWGGFAMLWEIWPELPEKLVRAKLRKLYFRDLINGCPCGCRGDFQLTIKGEEYLDKSTWIPEL